MHGKTTRRGFLRKSALVTGGALALPYIMPRSALAQGEQKLGVGVIGSGGMGGYATDQACNEKFVAICDVDDNRLAESLTKVANKVPDAPTPVCYYDYRRMIEDCADSLDVVLISTPDHHHAPAAKLAMEAGLHVFVQKPMAHNIRECQILGKMAEETGLKTQMGNQGHCGEMFRRACEWIGAGAVGDVTETHSILGRNFGGTGGRPESKPIPPTLHWEQWLGPAPFREYHDNLHPFNWRSWRDFGTGTIGDMACHNVDCVFFALRVYEAKTYTMECLNTNGGSEEMCNQDNIVRYDIPARGDMPPVQVFVYDNKSLMPEVMKEAEGEFDFEVHEDTLYIGEKGHFLTGGHAGQARILEKDLAENFEEPDKTMARAHGGPIEDLYWCIKNDGTPASNFVTEATPLTSFVLAGQIAQAAGVGEKVEWDVEKMESPNKPELNGLVGRTYREGWEV